MASGQYFTYRYRIEQQLGSGGMGVVFEATDLLKQKQIALKQLRTDIDSSSMGYTSPDDLKRAMAEEFRILASLRHPNIISVLDYGLDATGQPFYTMELLSEVEELLTDDSRTPGETVHLLVELLQALMYLHRHGIVHRDLKPGNVVLDAQRNVRVLDFGLSQQQGSLTALAGTLAYIAPELLMEQPVSVQADLYAVGVIAYQLFEKQHPFGVTDDTQFLQRVLYQPPASFTQQTPPDIQYVIQRLLAKDPDDRYFSAEAVIHALSRAIDEPAPVDTSAQRESFIQAARFVGREAELDQLTTAMHRIQDMDSSGSTWLIGGESGVGKSRLLDEIRTHALLNGVTVLFGQAGENAQTPLHVWQAIVRHLILMTSHEADELAVFQTVFGEINRLLDQSIPVVPEGANIQSLFTTHLNMLLERYNAPLLLLLEDLHWANESLQVLERLITSRHPGLMIIGTYRNDEAPNLPDRFPQANRITLNRLSLDEIQALSVSILGETDHQHQVASFLERETRGNAFFIVEVIRSLAESAGHLSAVGRVTLDGKVFTEGMRRLIIRRLEQLPDVHQPLLRLAAVQGRQLDTDLLTTLHGKTVQSFLYAAAEAGILDVRDNRWRFAHDKFREAVLDALTETEKMALHRRIAMTLEQRLDAPMNQAGTLAFHWGAAGAIERESPYLLEAARTAFQSSLFRDAWNWMQRSIDIDAWQHVAHTPQDKARFLREVGSTAYQLGHYDAAIEYHQKAYQILEGLNDWLTLAEILGSLGDIFALTGRFDEAENHLSDALVYAYASSDDERTGIVLMNLAALEARRNNMTDAISIMQQSYEHLKRTDNQVELAKALNNVALGYAFQGEYDRSLTYHQQALNLRRQLNDRHGLISSNRNLASLYMHHFDDLEQANALLAEAHQIAEQLALHEDRIAVWSILADLAQKRGNSVRAEEHLLESVRLARRIQNPVLLAEQLRQQSDFYYDEGEIDLAAPTLREALKIRHDQSHSRPQDMLIARSARLLEKQQQYLAALSLLVYAEKQDVLDTCDELSDLYRDLQTTLPAEIVAEAIQKGKKMSRAEATRWLSDELLKN